MIPGDVRVYCQQECATNHYTVRGKFIYVKQRKNMDRLTKANTQLSKNREKVLKTDPLKQGSVKKSLM
jgi:hypothetical protein